MDQERTYKWIQERLRELNAGSIAEEDFRELRAIALQDPFVADALEGYAAHPDYDHEDSLETLKQRIQPVHRLRRRWLIPNLTVTAVAASLILIVGFYAVMTKLSSDKENDSQLVTSHEVLLAPVIDTTETIAVNDEEEVVFNTEPATESEKATSATHPTLKKEQPESGTSTGESAARERKQDRDQSIDVINKETKPAVAYQTDDLSSPAPVYAMPASDVGVAEESRTEDALKEGMYANQMNPAVMLRKATGRVITESGTPLFGANIVIRGTNLGTISDPNGRFELFLPGKEATIDVISGGYAETAFQLKQGDEDVDVPLREIASAAGNMAMGASKVVMQTDQRASPKMQASVTAFDDHLLFVDYLKANSKYPLADFISENVKTVIVEFTVGTDGHPAQVKVVTSSFEKTFDEEALRLVRKGPDWECEEGYPCKVRFSFYFKG